MCYPCPRSEVLPMSPVAQKVQPKSFFHAVALSTRQRQQRGFVAGLAGRLLHDQGHRDEVVVTDDTDQVHDAALAELAGRRLERGVGDVLVAVELGAELVER